MKREVRVFKGMEIRASEDGKIISGYAAVHNQLSEDLGGFREVILPGAFTRCLGAAPDVRCLFNHDPNLILGRTKAGTLSLAEDPVGLNYDCDVPDTQTGRDVLTSIRRKDVDQCSFAFSVNKQNWREEKAADGTFQVIRELIDVDLYDVSPVTYPAYPQTTVSARSLWPDGEPEEVREHRAGGAPAVSVPAPAAPPAQEPEASLLRARANALAAVIAARRADVDSVLNHTRPTITSGLDWHLERSATK